VKPAPFDYLRPSSLDEALAMLAAHGPAAKPLAGGQSLVPAMNFRLAQPAVLVDLNRVPGLDGIDVVDGRLRLGGMVRHRTLEHDPAVAAHAPLAAAAMPLVAHAPIRTRGTLGGSLAHADPAAELPAVMLALDAAIEVRSGAGARTIPAADFFLGLFTTALAEGEIVVGVSLPTLPAGAGWAIDEVSRRHGDFALAGVAAVITLGERGRVATAAIALIGAHDRAVRAVEAERALLGHLPAGDALRTAGAAAARRDADPPSDVHASSGFRRHLVDVLVQRVVARAASRATPAG
jgi:carbon-monoxide dehydrogenase medium subunit